MCGVIPIQALIGDQKLATAYQKELNPFASFTLLIWFELVKELNLRNYIQVLKWVAYDSEFKPNQLDLQFKNWSHKGINVYCKILDKNGLQSFQTLQEKYGLGKSDFFRYLQLRQYLSSKVTKEINTQSNEIINLISQTYYKGCKSVISKLYQGILKSRGTSTDYIKGRWERELSSVITSEQWDNMCETAISTSSSAYWREFSWKNLVRFFITPKQQTRGNSSCWRSCGETVANHTHIFWSCRKLSKFWEDVISKIEQTIGFKSKQRPVITFYLGDLPEELTSNDKYLLKILTAAAKKAITRKWLCTDPPVLDDWLSVVEEIHKMEKLTFLLRLQANIYTTRWDKWLKYIRN